MTVANRKTVSGFLHVSWRTAGAVARRVAERVKASMPSPFDGLTAIGVDETSHRKGHTYLTVVVDHERHRVIWAHDGVGGEMCIRDRSGLSFDFIHNGVGQPNHQGNGIRRFLQALGFRLGKAHVADAQ